MRLLRVTNVVRQSQCKVWLRLSRVAIQFNLTNIDTESQALCSLSLRGECFPRSATAEFEKLQKRQLLIVAN